MTVQCPSNDHSASSTSGLLAPAAQSSAGVAYRKTGLRGILFISTVDPLQPPRATVHPPLTSSSLHLRLFIHGLLFIQPPPRATPPATIQPTLSTGSCSTTPPRATVHPAHHRLLFILPSTGWSCSSSPPRGPIHPPARPIGVLFIKRQRPLLPRVPIHPTPIRNCSSKPAQQRTLFIQGRWQQCSIGFN